MSPDKTDTIKQRRIDVYLPTLEAKERWKEEADERDQSLSEMVFQLVETILSDEREDYRKRAEELEDKVADLTAQIAEQRERIEELETLYERAQKDLEEYRAQSFLGDDPVKELDPRLIRTLSEATTRHGRQRAVDEDELRESLRIDRDDVEQMKALQKQLEYLELHDVIERTTKGWTWNV